MGLTNKNKITHTQNEGQNKQLANNEKKFSTKFYGQSRTTEFHFSLCERESELYSVFRRPSGPYLFAGYIHIDIRRLYIASSSLFGVNSK